MRCRTTVSWHNPGSTTLHDINSLTTPKSNHGHSSTDIPRTTTDELNVIFSIYQGHNNSLYKFGSIDCFRIHAEFQLNQPPHYPFWFTPAQFTGHLTISKDGRHVHSFNMFVPNEKKLNVGGSCDGCTLYM